MIEEIKDFIKKAGQYSEDARAVKHNVGYKWGNEAVLSVVTEVDLKISAMFKEFVAENFGDLNYGIIDEESLSGPDADIFAETANTEYQFILDPIDGTINYAAGLPFYGILLAVFKQGKPLYGFVYAPALKEMVYSDGEFIYHEKNGAVERLDNFSNDCSRVIQAHSWEVKFEIDKFNSKFIVEDYFVAAMHFLFMPQGCFKAVIARGKLWDVAPMMAFAPLLGMGFYDWQTQENFTQICPEEVDADGQVKKMHIICLTKDFSEVKNVISRVKIV